MVQFQLTIFMCPRCTIVFNSSDDCQTHESNDCEQSRTKANKGVQTEGEPLKCTTISTLSTEERDETKDRSSDTHCVNDKSDVPGRPLLSPQSAVGESHIEAEVGGVSPDSNKVEIVLSHEPIFESDYELKLATDGQADICNNNDDEPLQSFDEQTLVTYDSPPTSEVEPAEPATGGRHGVTSIIEPIKARRSRPKKRHACSVCQREHKKHSELLMHMRRHTGERPFTCAVCHADYASRGALKAHERGKHAMHMDTINIRTERVPCPLCKLTFANNNSLKEHIRWHAGVRPHNCPACDRTFSHDNNMRMHYVSMHEGGAGTPRVTCRLCDKQFAYQAQLNRHVKQTGH